MNTNNFKMQHTFYTYFTLNKTVLYTENKKISNAPKGRKPSCEHVDGQCHVDF